MNGNGRAAYISDLNQLRDWIDERIERLRQETAADLQQLRQDLLRVTDDHERRLRELERARWKAAGWAAGLGSVLGALSGRLLDRLFGGS